jgi:phosphatidylserine/phosphatidylglycerophosphate/cardiolipin synthase-like enzyme
MFGFKLSRSPAPTELLASSLFDEETFYNQFLKDLKSCRHELVIESPFVTTKRLTLVLPELEKLKAQRVRVIINTRDPEEQDNEFLRKDARSALSSLQRLGIQVVFTTGHHRKVAILDREILYEGSLNILSQNKSCEVMRRIESVRLAWEMARFVKIDQFIQ